MATKRVLIYGGNGALGANCVSAFKAQNWWVGSVATKPNDIADANILVDTNKGLVHQDEVVSGQLQGVLGSNLLDAVICVAGGWAGGNASSKDFAEVCELTWKQSVISSVIASSVAAKYLKGGGLLALTSSSASLKPTPGIIGYGMAKASVNHLTKSLAASESGLPEDSTVVAILPELIDTPNNRKWMPKADRSSWTPLDFIHDLFIKWANNEERPASGSLVELRTRNNKTELKYH